MIRRVFSAAVFVLLFCASASSHAALRYTSFLQMCGRPNQQCYGFLLGVLESRQVYIERTNSTRKLNKAPELELWSEAEVWCFPAGYESAANQSLDAYLERVRQDVLAAVRQKRSTKKWDKDVYPFNTAGQNIFGEALDELYSCRKPSGSKWNAEPIW